MSCQCQRCPLKTRTQKRYLKHLELYHQSEPNFVVECGQNGCPSTYTKISSLRKHITRKHRTTIQEENPEVQRNVEDHFEEEPHIETSPLFLEKLAEVKTNLKRDLAFFILMLQEVHTLPQVIKTSVAKDVGELFHKFTVQYQELLKICLEETAEVEQNLSILLEDNIFDTCFEEIKFYQCCINDFGLVEPIEYLLGHDSHGKKESFQYIPILKVLQTILTRSDIRNHVLEDTRVSTGGILGDFCDGSIFRNHPFFSVSEKQLQIQLYTDEFEVLNCLGV